MDAAYLIYQRLLGPWLGINPIEHYMIIVWPSLITWQFLMDFIPSRCHIKYLTPTIKKSGTAMISEGHTMIM